jgi:hypothetical protein
VDSGISCPWVWMPYADTVHGNTANSGKLAVLNDWPMQSRAALADREAEADKILAKFGMGDHGPTERFCDVCSSPLNGRGDRKTCDKSCRQKLSYQCQKVVAELIALGYEDVRERIEQDDEFAEMVRQTALERLTVSVVATAVATAASGDIGNVDDDEWLWVTQTPQPEHAVTGDQPSWRRVSRYDNPHHLRWPWRVSGGKHRPVSTGRSEPVNPRQAVGPMGPIMLCRTSRPVLAGHFHAEGTD